MEIPIGLRFTQSNNPEVIIITRLNASSTPAWYDLLPSWLHPLAKFPGPKLAAASRWYEAYYDLILRGKYTRQIQEMHKKIRPCELHVIDPKFYEKLYCQDGRWDKYDWSYDTFRAPLTARNPDRLVGRLDGFVTSGKRHNLSDALSAFARDLWMITKHLRRVGGTLVSLPIPAARMIGGNQNQAFFAFLDGRLKDTAGLMAKTNLVHAIVQSKLPPAEKIHRRVAEEVASILGAGFETTATVMRIVLYHMYSRPEILARLRSELESARYTSKGQIPGDLDWVKPQQLPYLTAILIAPDRDLFYENWCIPADTPVGMTTILMHHDEQLYPDPKSFIPDRRTDLDVRRKADKFYAGHQKLLAWSELYMLVATFTLLFDFKFDGAGLKDVEITVDYFIIGTEDQSGIMTWVKRH
ncbi:trichodiene oxygenase [Xylaria digitata]|nr:trichodiene oxygenase [Xylaria digitata]